MDLSGSKDERLLAMWESVRQQVVADLASGGRYRFIGDNVRPYAEKLQEELDRRQLRYAPIDWGQPQSNLIEESHQAQRPPA